MKTELSFLLDLLLNYKLPANIKSILSERIKQVEASLMSGNAPQTLITLPFSTPQVGKPSHPITNPEEIAQTEAARKALQSRQEAIQNSLAGKIDKDRTSPRKF